VSSLVTGKKEIIIQMAETLRLNLFVLFPDRIGSLKMWLCTCWDLPTPNRYYLYIEAVPTGEVMRVVRNSKL
jgi:hypothetical protein